MRSKFDMIYGRVYPEISDILHLVYMDVYVRKSRTFSISEMEFFTPGFLGVRQEARIGVLHYQVATFFASKACMLNSNEELRTTSSDHFFRSGIPTSSWLFAEDFARKSGLSSSTDCLDELQNNYDYQFNLVKWRSSLDEQMACSRLFEWILMQSCGFSTSRAFVQVRVGPPRVAVRLHRLFLP